PPDGCCGEEASACVRTGTNRDRENARIAASVFIQAPPAKLRIIPFLLHGGKVPSSGREMVSPNKRYRNADGNRPDFRCGVPSLCFGCGSGLSAGVLFPGGQ